MILIKIGIRIINSIVTKNQAVKFFTFLKAVNIAIAIFDLDPDQDVQSIVNTGPGL